MNILTAKWPFYVSGPLLALLLAGSLCLFGDPVGLTAAMTAMTEYCDSAVAGQSLPDAPAMDWQLAMLFGLFFGALIAAPPAAISSWNSSMKSPAASPSKPCAPSSAASRADFW